MQRKQEIGQNNIINHIVAKLQSKKINVATINQGKLYRKKLPQNAYTIRLCE